MTAYSSLAQPFLDAIAEGVFRSSEFRNWMLMGTPFEAAYKDSIPLEDEQRTVRWASKPTKQPFWANYWCGRDSACTCRIEGSKGLESDAIFFLQNEKRRVLAIHVEFKHPKERFGFGQPECYPLRAACFAATHAQRKTLNAHDDWATVLFCGAESLSNPLITNFQRVVEHTDAAQMLKSWPQ